VKNPTELEQLLELVTDRDSFLAFAGALVADRVDEVEQEKQTPSSPYGPGANGWENSTIEAFLDAALAWARSTRMGQTQGLAAEPSWKAFAVFLYSGKVYE
jgi:hypothetical protein